MNPNLPLFDARPSGGLEIRRSEERLFYACPGCGGEMSQGIDEEPIAELEADPFCCFCRAEFAGQPFSTWRRLPMEERRQHRPPQGFISTRVR